MESISDSELLRQFSLMGDEAAFGRLAERHAPMILGAAQRCTGDLDMAEEVTQTVLAILARKAASVPSAHLAGWLYNTAYLEARNARRKAARYRMALHKLSNHTIAAMAGSPGPPPDSTPWEDIRPHLDEALSRLPEKARQPIMMRFFEKHSIREIAAAAGKSEHASRKELERSLQRLGVMLQKKGIFTSAPALAGILAGQSLCVPPVSAATLGTAALKITSALSSASLLTPTVYLMTTTQSAKIAAIVFLAALPATILWWQKSALEDEIRSLRSVPHISQTLEPENRRSVPPAGDKPVRPETGIPAEPRANTTAAVAAVFAKAAMLKRVQESTVKEIEKELTRISLNLPDLTVSQKERIKGALEKRNREKLDEALTAVHSGALARFMSDPENVSADDKAALAALDPAKAGASMENDPLKDILTEEQLEVYTDKKEEKRVSDAETWASDALKSLGGNFDLSPKQKDQIFQALARQQLFPVETGEAEETTLFAGFGAREEARDQIIRESLTPEQTEIFNKLREEEKRGMEKWLKPVAELQPGGGQ